MRTLIHDAFAREKLITRHKRYQLRKKTRAYDSLASKRVFNPRPQQQTTDNDESENIIISAFTESKRRVSRATVIEARCDVVPEVREMWEQKLHKNEMLDDETRAKLKSMPKLGFKIKR